jgi:hypothetical protein
MYGFGACSIVKRIVGNCLYFVLYWSKLRLCLGLETVFYYFQSNFITLDLSNVPIFRTPTQQLHLPPVLDEHRNILTTYVRRLTSTSHSILPLALKMATQLSEFALTNTGLHATSPSSSYFGLPSTQPSSGDIARPPRRPRRYL